MMVKIYILLTGQEAMYVD